MKRTPAEMQADLDAVRRHGSVAAAARAMGLPRPTLQHRTRIARAALPDALPSPENRAGWATGSAAAPAAPLEKPRYRVKAGSSEAPEAAYSVPLSQDETKITHASREDVIAALRAMAEADPDQVITRNHFRVHSKYAESAWNVHFGTFEEFKRQGEITLSRHAHRLERSIAKHASVDKMRLLNAEKRQWAGAYLRPAAGRWQTCIVASDLHGLRCDPFYLRVLLDTIARVQPEKIVLPGDVVDLAEFSKHAHDPRDFAVVAEIEWLHAFLASIRKAAPDAELTYVEGNHEVRLLRHMGEQTPAMQIVLSDLHGFTVPKLLGLERFQVNYIARADMTAFTERDIKAEVAKNYALLFGGALLLGHYPSMRAMGVPGASGHHHKHLVWSDYSPTFGPWEWHQMGCGHVRSASYCNAQAWGNGFLIVHLDTRTKRSQFEYVDVSHHGAMVGGRFYERQALEVVPDLPAALAA